MIRYIVKRVVLALISLFILLTIVYLLTASFADTPYQGDPNDYQQWMEYNGFNKPVIVRYCEYLSGFFRGDFGSIYSTNNGFTNIPSFFFKPLTWTILITIPAFIISVVIGVFLGIIAGYNRGKWIDVVINLFVVIFIGLPSFVIAPIILLIANSSNGAILSEFTYPDIQGWAMTIKSLVLPIITVTLGSLAGYTILVRNQMVSILTSNHILIAKAKGLTQWEIFWKHIIRNISIPLISYMVPSFIMLLMGNIIIEQFFGVPGASTVIMQAFPNGEINIVMFSIFFIASLSMAGQIILDISYIFIDPKIKYFESTKISIVKNIVNKFKREKNLKENENQYVKERAGDESVK
ncbi:MAG: ABC transporter permease [Mycoplasma sp.]|nr:ABC transporter permease [Mycoplasma sp.]